MSGSSDQPSQDDVAAMEAAAWFARNVHRPSADDAEDFGAWRSAQPANRAAYAAAEEIWSDLDTLLAGSDGASAAVSAVRSSARPRVPLWTAGLALCAALLAILFFYIPGSGQTFQTEVGAQHIARLDDGTTVALNTDTRLEVQYGEDTRAVVLDHGEALFDVARDSSRPFVVSVEGNRITALGTSFVVRNDDRGIWVALIEGSVRVNDADGETIVLRPGNRLALNSGDLVLDNPQMDSLVAWRRGELVFDHTPLPEAIYEINRYTDRPIVLQDSAARKRHVTGSFRVQRSEEFADSVAALYGLNVAHRDGSIILEPAR